MDGFEKYQLSVLQAASDLADRITEEHKDELVEVMLNELLDREGPVVLDRNFSDEDYFVGRLFHGFSEIVGSFNNLLDIETYIGRFPYGNTRITKVRHLGYHIGNFLNEVYILKERLLAYLTRIGRLYKGDSSHSDILRKIHPLFRLVKKNLDNILKVRGRHVHRLRYSDRALDKLSTLEVLSINIGRQQYTSSYEYQYKHIRKEWKNKVASINEEIKKILDQYFEQLFTVVCDADFNLVYPERK